jgi:hypothetical protein
MGICRLVVALVLLGNDRMCSDMALCFSCFRTTDTQRRDDRGLPCRASGWMRSASPTTAGSRHFQWGQVNPATRRPRDWASIALTHELASGSLASPVDIGRP